MPVQHGVTVRADRYEVVPGVQLVLGGSGDWCLVMDVDVAVGRRRRKNTEFIAPLDSPGRFFA